VIEKIPAGGDGEFFYGIKSGGQRRKAGHHVLPTKNKKKIKRRRGEEIFTTEIIEDTERN
jgi:hypothetical protein